MVNVITWNMFQQGQRVTFHSLPEVFGGCCLMSLTCNTHKEVPRFPSLSSGIYGVTFSFQLFPCLEKGSISDSQDFSILHGAL